MKVLHNTSIKIVLIILLLLVTAFQVSARVVSSQTITLYAYIEERTTVEINFDGEILFTSNNPLTLLDVTSLGETTLLSVVSL